MALAWNAGLLERASRVRIPLPPPQFQSMNTISQLHTPSAIRAIKLLEALLSKSDSEHLAFWVSPNMILTLAGARGYADGVFYSENQELLNNWADQIQTGVDKLAKTTDIRIHTIRVSKTVHNESYVIFDILLQEGFAYSIEHSALIDSALMNKVQSVTSFEDFFALLKTHTTIDLVQTTDPDVIEHIAQGVLLGYPDSAIVDYLNEQYEEDKFAPPLIDADIRGANYYDCPRPIYSYHRNLITDSSIVTHEKLWSQILTEYYTSDFHKSLEADPLFHAKLKEIGALR